MIGPFGANIFNPRSWTSDVNALTLEIMRLTLATGVFAIGVELPPAYLANQWKDLALMVVPTMAWGWLISAGFMFWIFPSLSFISALCISACLTPTDPVCFSTLNGNHLSHCRPRFYPLPSLQAPSQRIVYQREFALVSHHDNVLDGITRESYPSDRRGICRQ